MKVLLATRNAHKVRELSRMLEGLPIEVVGLDAFPAIGETVEDGRTLEDNARKKALEASASGLWSLADDTGLEVAALGGEPGVRSARYAGERCDFAANNRKLLAALAGVPPERRGATFRCVIALCSPQGKTTLREGRLEGRIAEGPSGAGGFGYDPVFFVPSLGRTLAELSEEEKNRVSHRGRALAAMRPELETLASAGSRR